MRMHKYPTLGVVLAAVAIVIWAVLHFEMRTGWVLFFIVAAMTIPFTTRRMLSVLFTGTPLLMAIAMIYGTPACVVAATLYALMAAVFLRLKRAGTVWVLCAGFGYMVCEAFLYSAAYHVLKPVNLFLAIVAMAFVSYLVTSLLRNERETWTDRFPLLLNPILAASCAAFLSVFDHPFVLLVALPAIAVIRYWTKIHESRLGGPAPNATPAASPSAQ